MPHEDIKDPNIVQRNPMTSMLIAGGGGAALGVAGSLAVNALTGDDGEAWTATSVVDISSDGEGWGSGGGGADVGGW